MDLQHHTDFDIVRLMAARLPKPKVKIGELKMSKATASKTSGFKLSSLKNMTNDQRVLAYLRANRTEGLDAITSFDKIGVHRLSAAVNKLRNEGHNIVSEDVVYESIFGDEVTVTSYRLKR